MIRARATAGSSELPLGAFLAQLAANERFLTPMFAEIRDRIKARAAGGPIVISVDDVHLLDDSSAVLVHQMVSAGEAQLLATLRTGQLAPRGCSMGASPHWPPERDRRFNRFPS